MSCDCNICKIIKSNNIFDEKEMEYVTVLSSLMIEVKEINIKAVDYGIDIAQSKLIDAVQQMVEEITKRKINPTHLH